MSAPNLIVWLPSVLVQLFTNWNCCSLSVSGQLQRPIFKPSPNGVKPPVPPKSMPARPPVVGGPTIPWAQLVPAALLLLFRHGTPNPSIGEALASEYAVCGLYLKYPNRKSVNHFVPMGFVKPVARL